MSCRFVIIDALAVFYRSFYAIKELSTADGVPTNAIFGFIKSIEKLSETLDPSHIAVIFDGGLPEERTKLLKEYKAQRPPMPDKLRVQLPLAEEFMNLCGISWLRVAGKEADDVIASIAVKASGEVDNVLIASNDKDIFQIIGGRIKMASVSGKWDILDSAYVREKTGVEPGRIVDWLALMGDSADNIAGVPGIGGKTAAKLLNTYGSIDGIYSNIEEIASVHIKEALLNSRDIVERNQRLVRLRTDLPVDFDLAASSVARIRTSGLSDFFEKLELESFQRQVGAGKFLQYNLTTQQELL